MTPKEKALSLIKSMSFSNSRQMNYANGEMVDIPQNLYAKQCALVAVNTILSTCIDEEEQYRAYKYWQEVKQEIEKI